MATVDENLIAFLLADTNSPAVAKLCGGRIHQNYVPPGNNGMSPTTPYVWFSKSDDSGEDAIDDAAGTVPFNSVYDLECWAATVREAIALKDAVRKRLHLARGTFGAGTVQGVYVTGQGGDYQLKGTGATGMNAVNHGEAMLVEIKGHA
jgi:hypothetical protein